MGRETNGNGNCSWTILWSLGLLAVITVAESMVIIPVGSQEASPYDSFDDGIAEDPSRSMELAYEDPSEPQQFLPNRYLPTDNSDEPVAIKRYLRSGRRHQEYEGRESRPGLPLRFGKRSLARYVLGRVVVKVRRAKSQAK